MPANIYNIIIRIPIHPTNGGKTATNRPLFRMNRTGQMFAYKTNCRNFAATWEHIVDLKMIANKNQADVERLKSTLRKMVTDKRAISKYIREHGSLSGFKDDSIQFSKPL